MALGIELLASGPGWSVRDVVCDYGPHDHAFIEQHAETAISAVTRGSFQYRTRAGSAVLVPGSLLLGNAGNCFECGEEIAEKRLRETESLHHALRVLPHGTVGGVTESHAFNQGT